MDAPHPSPTMARVLMVEDMIGDIPALHCAPVAGMDGPLPTIFLYHGYRSSKEIASFLGYMLAAAGFRAVLPEAQGHGARYDGDDSARLTQFYDILKTNIDELPFYRDHYAARGLIAEGRIGVAGLSMGGFATLGCMVRHGWIRAAASTMGSGYFNDIARTVFPPLGRYDADTAGRHAERLEPLRGYDVADHLDRLSDRPLFIWHGARDDVVPVGESLRLLSDLISCGATGRLTFMVDPLAGHRLTTEAATAVVTFFQKNL